MISNRNYKICWWQFMLRSRPFSTLTPWTYAWIASSHLNPSCYRRNPPSIAVSFFQASSNACPLPKALWVRQQPSLLLDSKPASPSPSQHLPWQNDSEHRCASRRRRRRKRRGKWNGLLMMYRGCDSEGVCWEEICANRGMEETRR